MTSGRRGGSGRSWSGCPRPSAIVTPEEGEKEGAGRKAVVDVGRLGPGQRRALLDRLVGSADRDNERFLRELRERIDILLGEGKRKNSAAISRRPAHLHVLPRIVTTCSRNGEALRPWWSETSSERGGDRALAHFALVMFLANYSHTLVPRKMFHNFRKKIY